MAATPKLRTRRLLPILWAKVLEAKPVWHPEATGSVNMFRSEFYLKQVNLGRRFYGAIFENDKLSDDEIAELINDALDFLGEP